VKPNTSGTADSRDQETERSRAIEIERAAAQLWELSSPDTELIFREEYSALMEHLTEQRREMKDMVR
jgi:hypothetical protein